MILSGHDSVLGSCQIFRVFGCFLPRLSISEPFRTQRDPTGLNRTQRDHDFFFLPSSSNLHQSAPNSPNRTIAFSNLSLRFTFYVLESRFTLHASRFTISVSTVVLPQQLRNRHPDRA